MKKHRPDSVIGQLDLELREQVHEMLLSGEPYKKVKAMLAEADVRISIQSISEYYRRRLLPLKIARENRTAAELQKISSEGLNEATLCAIRSTVFELASSPSPNPKVLNTLFGLVLKAEKLGQDARKLKLLEAKAAEADKAKEVTQNKQLTDEEKRNRYKEIFGIK